MVFSADFMSFPVNFGFNSEMVDKNTQLCKGLLDLAIWLAFVGLFNNLKEISDLKIISSGPKTPKTQKNPINFVQIHGREQKISQLFKHSKDRWTMKDLFPHSFLISKSFLVYSIEVRGYTVVDYQGHIFRTVQMMIYFYMTHIKNRVDSEKRFCSLW